MKLVRVTLVFNRRKTGSAVKAASVEIRVTWKGRQKFFSTGVSVLPKQWDARGLLVRGHADADVMNRSLEGQRRNVLDVIEKLGDGFSLDRLGDALRGGPDVELLDYIARRVECRAVRESTRKRYRSWFATFKEWAGMRCWADVSYKNIVAYDEWLKGRAGWMGDFKQCSVYTHMAALRSFLNDAVVDEYLPSNPFVTKRIKIGRGNKRHADTLSPEQLSMVEALRLEGSPSMERVKDLFLFQCYTGLAYSDMCGFCREGVVSMGGVELYRGKRVKTGVEFMFVLLPKARALLDKYGWRLPVISNQKYNQYLKVVGMAIGVERLHSHMGRATCATVMLSAGVPVSVIQRVLGHSLASMTEHYASLADASLVSEMCRLG